MSKSAYIYYSQYRNRLRRRQNHLPSEEYMYALLLIAFLQAQRPPDIASPHTPTISQPKEARQVQLAPPTKTTTPQLNSVSELMTHYQIGVEVRAQREASSALQYNAAALE